MTVSFWEPFTLGFRESLPSGKYAEILESTVLAGSWMLSMSI